MKTKLKAVSALGALAVATGVNLAVAGPASASSPSCGSWSDDLSICGSWDPAGYHAGMSVYSDSNIEGDIMRFSLRCPSGTFYDDGAFNAYPGHTYTYTFSVGARGTCTLWVTNYTQGYSATAGAITHN